ncbi:hypothetical protein HNO53_20600 [Billgrantia antri]|uniref:Uncharacterized protein n=1 Tax=Halomonas sulfidivorans TaxID=2733488 RepID=A0ABX7WLP9_9GAMM|nr:hypothetical protein [Halomonas sulfidivorans]QTP60900.1 hypothetical protein HNO53_20600 [Halomonas sulfidivorans]
MNQHDTATVFTYPVKELAEAWREHAQRHGITDPETQLLAREAVHGSPRAGYRPAWYVPSTGELVVIIAAEPHWTEAQAIDWLRWMLEQLHANGSVTLYAHDYAEQAPAQEATA